VKKLLIFFIIIFLVSCASIWDESKDSVNIDCPKVYFSKENNTYIDNIDKSSDLEKVAYKASLNNYSFSGNCKTNLVNSIFNLELLILAKPINPSKKLVNLPIFILLYDAENNLLDKQYFRIVDNLNYNSASLEFEITDIITSLKIKTDNKLKVDNLTIGFVKLN
tara:strand:- start:146 stop:640 length:495 start_codon:yes stop_codon:yes gene_type:complete